MGDDGHQNVPAIPSRLFRVGYEFINARLNNKIAFFIVAFVIDGI